MASINLRFKPLTKNSDEVTIYYQIVQDRVTRQISSGFRVAAEDWNKSRSILNVSSVMARDDINTVNQWDRVRFELKRMRIIAQNNSAYSSDDLVAQFVQHHRRKRLFGFTLDTINRLKTLGNISNANNYYSMLISFMSFRKGIDIDLKLLDGDIIEAYEAYLKHNKAALNTISFYMRTLRAIFNRAVEKGLAKEQNIFKRVYTSIEKTAKRAIPLEVVTALKEADLEAYPKLAFTRDLFMFSFYTRGMSFVDIAYLKKSDIRNGEFTYRRSKTGQSVRVAWEKCMEDIVDRHSDQNSEYLLPIIIDRAKDARQQYVDMRNNVNRNLKRIMTILGISLNITMYVARHTWASAAKHKNISISVISEAMGHDSEMTTKIYLAALDTAVIDDANRLIIDSV